MDNKSSFFQRLCELLTCLLMLLAIAVSKDGAILGHQLDAGGKGLAEASADQDDTSFRTVLKSGDKVVVNTTELGSDVFGFGGPVPLELTVKGGIIKEIKVLQNSETQAFIESVEEQLISKYIGMSLEEAGAAEVDAVSGATYSSKAVMENIRRAIAAASDGAVGGSSGQAGDGDISLKMIAALLISLAAAIVPLITKNKVYRTVQLTLNVLVLGLWTGTFVSYASVTGYLANGMNLWKSLAAVVLLIVAFLYPLFGKKGHYCAWCCPMGSLQELAGKASKKKMKISPEWVKRLEGFRIALWCILMLLAWSGALFSWMDYEFFTAFLWQSASWIIILLAALTIVLSAFVNRPYCRFVCPTGTLLKSLH